MSNDAPPLILALVSDVFFNAPLEQAVRARRYGWRLIERGDQLEDPTLPVNQAFLGERLSGRGAAFLRQVVEWQPVLILVELSTDRIPWRDWVAAIKASPATRRVPVLAFGPHVDVALRQQALDVGCNAVVAKSRLLADLPALIDQYARRVDADALSADCQTPLSELALKGIALFDAHEFFEAHEELEHAWNADPGPAKELYRGILQVAVAYLQIQRGNYAGAMKMFLRLRQWLDPLPAVCRGVNVAQLRADALAAQAALEALGPERVREFPVAVFKPCPRA